MSLRVEDFEPAHLYKIKCRPEQVPDWYDMLRIGIAEKIGAEQLAYTLFDGEEIICIAGAISFGEKNIEVYTFLSQNFQKHLNFIIRWLKKTLDVLQLDNNIYSSGNAKWPFIPRWMRMLGFIPDGVNPGVGSRSEKYILYRRK